VGDQDPSKLNLDVYDTKEGLWNPEAGALVQPDGWEFLPSGDAFVTRRVKAAGTYWKLWRPRGRNRPHRRLLGLLAPKTAIEAALAEAASTEATRSGRRAQGTAYRARKEDIYRQELTEAVVAYLSFAPEHAELAESIAAEAAQRAAEVGSGRVGRTRTIEIDQRAALAARALIRHRYTDYEDRLVQEVWDDDFLYREVKAEAHRVVDDFLEEHRLPADL
jgi:hypothetical protein